MSTILLVDDDGAVRSAARRALEKAGHDVLEASDGVEARQRLDEKGLQVDLVIMDLVLPGLSGEDAGNLIQAHHPGLRVLYTSGFARSEARLPDDFPFLKKPFDVPGLLAAVDDALARR